MNPVRQLRSGLGLTQLQLAEKAGTSQPTIAAYEANKKSPTLETLKKLAHSLGVELAISFVSPLTKEDERSLAYHEAICEKLKQNPDIILGKAKKNLEFMSQKNPDARWLFELWEKWLGLSTQELIMNCLDLSLLSRDMRQVTPFAGVLSAKERLDVIKKLRGRNYI